MAKAQFPLDGKLGRDYKVTSPFGYRIHPIKKTRKHHNGVDLWKSGNPYLEAIFDGKVIKVIPNDSPTSGGHSVIVQSTVMGKKVTWTYFHMVKGSIKVKPGQKIEAGTIVGRMGMTGFATGPHLHLEIWAGHIKSQPLAGFATGKGYYDPMKFIASVIAFEKAHLEADKETPESAPVTVAPTHSVPEVPTVAVPKEAKVVAAEAKPAGAIKTKPTPKPVFHTVISGDTYWGMGEKYGVPYKSIQKLNKNAALKVGMKVRIK